MQFLGKAACALFGWWNELFGKLRAGAEEILLHLLHQELLGFGLPGLEPVFIQQHLGVFSPHAPSLGADVFINFLSQFSIEGGLIEAGEFTAEFDALYHTRHGKYFTGFM